MTKTRKIIKNLNKELQSTHLAKKFLNKNPIAKINGSSVVIEAIVQTASLNTGIDMDWCYCTGRGYVFADGNTKKARRELYLLMPKSDLTSGDLF